MILMLSMHSEETLVRQATAAGARGYILATRSISTWRAPSGESPAARRCSIQVTPSPALKGESDHRLTARELEVLQHICAGHSNRTIAGKLGLSVNTVAVHRANIMKTLGVHKTAELVVYAIQHGLVSML